MNPCSSLMLWYKWKLHFNQRRQDVRNDMFLNVTWVHCSFIVREHIKRVAFVLQTFPFSDYRNKHFWVSQLWLLTKITHLNTDTSLRHKMPCFIMSIYYLYTWSKSINVGQDEQMKLIYWLNCYDVSFPENGESVRFWVKACAINASPT